MKKIDNTECWKDIVGYEGIYQVSDLGNVRSLKFGKWKVLRPQLTRGYLRIGFRRKGEKQKCYLVHRLVYSSFNGPIAADMTVDHINGIRTDNRLENLQLLTREENTRKANKGKPPWNKGKKCKPSWNKGKPHSEETKAKMAAAAKARYQREHCGNKIS